MIHTYDVLKKSKVRGEGLKMEAPVFFPGTVIPVSSIGLLQGIFSVTNGITLSQVCEITGLEPGTIQNWIKRGYVNHPIDRKYTKGHLTRIILINILRDTFVIENAANLLSYVNGDLLDRADDIMDDSEIYQCLCNILIPEDPNTQVDINTLSERIDEELLDFVEPYDGAKEKLKLALKAMVFAWWSLELKRRANQLTENI
jgi:DNA-binding transcriptional MerR regulator